MPTSLAFSPMRRFQTDRPLMQHPERLERDREFLLMLEAYRGSGGLAPIAEVSLQLQRHHWAQSARVLAQWMARGELICFEWQARRWIPWFQFSRADMAPRAQLAPVLAELRTAYDPWEMGLWFVTPNPWLAGRVPVDALFTDMSEVLHAARADRFVVNG
ncbi:MAG: hypothetical protein ABIN37_11255 [Burkholderiaceae bacterium]